MDLFTGSITVGFKAVPPVVLVGVVVAIVARRLVVLIVLLRIEPPFIFILDVEDLVLLPLLVGNDAEGHGIVESPEAAPHLELDVVGGAIQQAIPSGVQFLVNALRQAFSLTRHGSKLSLSEFSVEFDSRYLNEVARS